MANENVGQNNGAGNSTENSFLDSLFSYLRERLDSPFLFCFLVSWLVINRDFCFYFALSEEVNKAQILANWDFRTDVFAWILVPYGNSFILPSFFGALAAIIFPPISYTVTAFKYFFSARAKSWALRGKSKFDLQLDISHSEIKLNEIKYDLAEYGTKLEFAKTDFSALEERITKAKMIKNNHSYFELLKFFSGAVKMSSEYRKNPSKFNTINSEHVKKNSLIEVTYTSSKSGKYKFNGTIAELFLEPYFCPIEDDLPAVTLELLIQSTAGKTVVYEYRDEHGSIFIDKIQQFVEVKNSHPEI